MNRSSVRLGIGKIPIQVEPDAQDPDPDPPFRPEPTRVIDRDILDQEIPIRIRTGMFSDQGQYQVMAAPGSDQFRIQLSPHSPRPFPFQESGKMRLEPFGDLDKIEDLLKHIYPRLD